MTCSAYDEIVSMGLLTIERPRSAGRPPLAVRLDALDEGRRAELRLHEGGLVWEDDAAVLSFSVESAAPLKKATLTVNDHNELYLETTWLPVLTQGGVQTFRYEFCLADKDAPDYRTPFLLSCGIARVTVRLFFTDGREAGYESDDLVCLNEPQAGGDGQSGERAEESNVRDMFRTLVEPNANQAAEWMFAPQADGTVLSSDDDTDWAHQPLSRLLKVASDTLDLIYDGLEDTTDAFPTQCEGCSRDGMPNYDTAENRAVRALLVSLGRRMTRVHAELSRATDERAQTLARLRHMVAAEGARRGRRQSLPAIALLEEQLTQEQDWLRRACDLAERSTEALELFDDYFAGSRGPADEPFACPPPSGIYETDARYQQLHAAMRSWARAKAADELIADASLYAVKPDRLFEYYALHRLLFWLYELGFREDGRYEHPISRHQWRLGATYHKYVNEWRCANTYHLCRQLPDGATQTVSLYYQPVIYARSEGENGVFLRRTDVPEGFADAFWTPDFLLMVDEGARQRIYAIDAKYSPRSSLKGSGGKLASCVRKYLAQTRTVGADGAEGVVDGVWILAGRLGGLSLETFDPVRDHLVDAASIPAGTAVTCGIAAWNRNTGRRKLGAFFNQLHIS